MKKILLVFVVALFSVTNSIAEELTLENYWKGLKESVELMGKGSYLQFTEINNLYYAAAGTGALWYSFEHDDRITFHEMNKKVPKYSQVISDLAPLVSFPFIQAGFYTYGLKHDDSKAIQFAKESFATMYLVLLESAALSLINVHERPKKDELSGWETKFRGKSSFPSGHVVPYAALAFKTLQFYGPLYAIIPTAAFVATGIQRVRDGKHYVSDVVGAFFLTAFASEGVRKAGKYEHNHPFYKAIFERNLRIGYIEYNGVLGPKVTFDW